MKIKTNGEKLQQLREARGLSRAQLAKEVGTSRWSVRYWEIGKCSPERPPEMPYKIAQVLGVHPEELWYDIEFDTVLLKKFSILS